MKRKLKQWWSSISTKRTITSYLNSLKVKKKATTYEVGNQVSGLGHKDVAGLKPVNENPPLLITAVFSLQILIGRILEYWREWKFCWRSGGHSSPLWVQRGEDPSWEWIWWILTCFWEDFLALKLFLFA
jgi:hypothetical protein